MSGDWRRGIALGALLLAAGSAPAAGQPPQETPPGALGASEAAPGLSGELPLALPDAVPEAPEAMLALPGEADAEAAPPPRELSGDIEYAWLAPAESLAQRVWRTRRTALEQGVWSLDPAARSLLAKGGAPLERAEAAVRLAPDLPLGHMELARSLWLHGDSPMSAIRAAFGALLAFQRHAEASLWLAGSLLLVLAAALVGGGLLCIAILGLSVAPHGTHDLADPVSRSMPSFARTALLLSGLLVLPVLGEGLLGLALGVLALAAAYGGRRQRTALLLASLAVLAGAYPVARLAGAALEALPADPVAQAALATSQGLALEADVRRLEAAAPDDLLARQALARLAHRSGNLGRADALYQSLLSEMPDDPVVVTNAANVRLHLGHMESALNLYHQALELEESPVVLFNLSQAYGQAFQVDDLTTTLEHAQMLDGDLVADLTRLQGTQPEGFVVDLPLSVGSLWRRVFDPQRGEGFAAAFRRSFAPGWLGQTLPRTAGALLVVLLLAGMGGARVRHSRWCARCGRRVCPRCHPEVAGGELCEACNRLFYQPEQTDRELRLARIEALREREKRLDKVAWAVSILVPGAAGVLAQRPMRSFWGALFFAIALGAVAWRQGAVPDPLVAGAAGPAALLVVATLSAVAYAIVVGGSLASRRGL